MSDSSEVYELSHSLSYDILELNKGNESYHFAITELATGREIEVKHLQNTKGTFSMFDLSFSEGAFITKEDLKNIQSVYEDLRLQRIHKIKSLSERQGRLNHIQNPIHEVLW